MGEEEEGRSGLGGKGPAKPKSVSWGLEVRKIVNSEKYFTGKTASVSGEGGMR